MKDVYSLLSFFLIARTVWNYIWFLKHSSHIIFLSAEIMQKRVSFENTLEIILNFILLRR